LYLGN
jgi:hypothetical protein